MQYDHHMTAYRLELEEMQKLWRMLSAIATKPANRTMAFLPSELSEMIP